MEGECEPPIVTIKSRKKSIEVGVCDFSMRLIHF